MGTLIPCRLEQRKDRKCTLCTVFQKEGPLTVTAMDWVAGPEFEFCLPQGLCTCYPFNLASIFSAIFMMMFAFLSERSFIYSSRQLSCLSPSLTQVLHGSLCFVGIAVTELTAISCLISIFPLNCEFPRSKDLIYPLWYLASKSSTLPGTQ